MKLYYSIFALSMGLLFLSCNKTEEPGEVTVGMTYEEVEAFLGKPESILRGINEIYSDMDALPEETINTLNMDTTLTGDDNNRWFAPHEVRTTGESLYATWVYDQKKTENFYVLYNKFKDTKESSSTKVPVYYIGNKEVSKEEYDAADKIYKVNDGTNKGKQTLSETIKKPKIPVDSLKSTKTKSDELPRSKMVEKRIEYVTKTSVSTNKVIDSTDKVNYEVEYKLCVVFDTSSGRVTEYDYFPFSVRKMNSGD